MSALGFLEGFSLFFSRFHGLMDLRIDFVFGAGLCFPSLVIARLPCTRREEVHTLSLTNECDMHVHEKPGKPDKVVVLLKHKRSAS